MSNLNHRIEINLLMGFFQEDQRDGVVVRRACGSREDLFFNGRFYGSFVC